MIKSLIQQLPKEYKIKGKIFTAKVVKIDKDETDKIGRIKVEIDELFKGISNDDLPWIMMRTLSKSGFSFIVPRIDDIVSVEFMDDNVYTGFYTTRIYNNDSKSDKADEDYPDTYVLWQDYKENLIKFNTKTDEFTFLHSSQTKVLIDKDGNVEVTIPKKLTMTVGDSAQIDVTGNVGLTVSENLTATIEGDTSITTTGKTDIKSTGKMNVESTGNDTSIKASGTVNIVSGGQTSITSGAGIDITATGDTNVVSSGTMDISSTGAISVTSPQINLN